MVLTPQRVYPDDRIIANARGGGVQHPDQGKGRSQVWSAIYDIVKADEDIAQPISKTAPLSAEWRPDLLGGVMTIKGQFRRWP